MKSIEGYIDVCSVRSAEVGELSGKARPVPASEDVCDGCAWCHW
jgi:NAD-dependent dihydropyrimidine dehydrogenase PreA subunit